MIVTRLTTVNDVVRVWPFLSAGLAAVSHNLRYNLELEVYRKTIFRLVKQHTSAWVGIAYDEDTPVAFVIAHDCTPFFSTDREFDASLYYHKPGYSIAVQTLQHYLETFLHSHDIRRYYVTTCRKSGRPMHVFGVEWSGLQHAYRVFKKEL